MTSADPHDTGSVAPSHPAPASTRSHEIRQRIPDARDLLLDALKASGVTLFIDNALACGARPLLFAGALRDAIMAVEHGSVSCCPRDFDIGLVGASRETFDGLLSELGAQPNRYAGYRLLHSAAPPIDVWRLEDTLGLRVHHAPCTIVNVLRSFVLDINTVVFDPVSGFFHSCGAVEAIRARRVGLIEDALVHSTATFAAKAVLSALRFSFSVAAPLERFVSRHLRPTTLAYEASKVFGPHASIQHPLWPAPESKNET